MECNEQGLLNYNEFVNYINWRENAEPPTEPSDVEVSVSKGVYAICFIDLNLIRK